MPHRPDATGAAGATSIGVYLMSLAVDFEGLVLRCSHHVSNRDHFGILGQKVAALRSADALHEPGSTQTKQNLLDVVSREPLGVGKLTCGDRAAPVPPALGQVDGD